MTAHRPLPTRRSQGFPRPAVRDRRARRRRRLRPAHRSGGQADRRGDGADAGLQRLDPGPDAEGGGTGLGSDRQRRQRGRPRGDRALARRTRREPLRRHPRDTGADRGRRQLQLPRPVPRSRVSTGTTRTSARTTARSWACTATSSSSPPTPTTGRRSIASSCSPSTTSCSRTGRSRPFSRYTRRTHVGEWAASATCCSATGEPDLPSTHASARWSRFYLTNTANTRVFEHQPSPAARMKLVGGDSGRLRARGVHRRGACWRRPSAPSSMCSSTGPAARRWSISIRTGCYPLAAIDRQRGLDGAIAGVSVRAPAQQRDGMTAIRRLWRFIADRPLARAARPPQSTSLTPLAAGKDKR